MSIEQIAPYPVDPVARDTIEGKLGKQTRMTYGVECFTEINLNGTCTVLYVHIIPYMVVKVKNCIVCTFVFPKATLVLVEKIILFKVTHQLLIYNFLENFREHVQN